MLLSAGNKLGPYEILSPLGAGGMGEVYVARDPRLNRTVAIKVMPKHIAARAELRERFEREARAVSGLNHPHICALFDVGNQDGVEFMVLEHLEGEPLSARIAKGALPLDQAVKFAMQIADALDRAHRKGVVHRDVKPGNVMLTRDGVKLLDFGLAKSSIKPGANDDTMSAALTQEGSVLGTAQYMAPELFEGEDADERSDIFAFGCVLYEMVTGHRAIKAVPGAQPPLMSTVKPAALERIVRRCLEKDPEDRYRSLHDVFLDLRSIHERPDAPVKVKQAWTGWAAAAVFMAIAAGASYLYLRTKPLEEPIVHLSLVPPANGRFSTEVSGVPHLAMAPDGKNVVFAAAGGDNKNQLWLRSLDSTVAHALAGSENGGFPFWSADSRSVAFFSSGKLRRIDVAGGPALPLADAPLSRGGTWNGSGVVVFSPGTNGPLWRVADTGGGVSPVTKLDAAAGETSHRFPSFLPDGKHFLYAVWRIGTNQVSLRAGSIDSPDVSKVLQDADSSALYADGRLLFLRGTTLMARPFDAAKLAFLGDAVPAISQVSMGTAAPGARAFSVSTNGWLVYASGAAAEELRLTWFSRSGIRRSPVGDPGNILQMRFSPDRRTVAASISEGGSNDIWLYDVQRGHRTRMTSDPALDDNPVWTPDDRSIFFRSNRNGAFGIYRKAVDGSGAEECIYQDILNKFPASLSPDGQFLAYYTFGDPKTGNDIWLLQDPLGQRGKPRALPFLKTEFLELNPDFSPDGKWIAYQSNESGRHEIYITAFPNPSGKRQVSTAGGTEPRWKPDGKELYYIGPDRRLMAAAIQMKGAALDIGKIEALFGGVTGGYDVSADGRQFLTVVAPEGKEPEPLTVVHNWAAGLKK